MATTTTTTATATMNPTSHQVAAPVDPTQQTINIKVEFTGGLETVFQNKRNLNISLSSPNPSSSTASTTPSSSSNPSQPTIATLINHLIETYIKDSPKKELFVMDGTVRPGILVLVNDADWELEGEAACELHEGDEVVFVSTLHGG